MKIKTELLQNMISKAIKGASNNNMIPITTLMGIEVKENILTLMTTDGSNQLRVKEKIESNVLLEPTDFYTLVNADIISKLVSKTTKEYIELINNDNYLLFKGNGEYKIEIPFNDEDGNIIKFPDISQMNNPICQKIDVSKLKTILNLAKNSVAKTMEIPYITGYYLSKDIITTDRQLICYIKDELFENPILIPSEIAELLQLLEGDTVDFKVENNNLLFETSNLIISGKELENKDLYPIQAIQGCLKNEYIDSIKVNKQDLLNVLDRMSLFVNEYDKNGVFLKFNVYGLTITSQKSNAVEVINAPETNNREEFQCLVDIEMLISEIQALNEEYVEIFYGHPSSIKLVEKNTTFIVSLIEEV